MRAPTLPVQTYPLERETSPPLVQIQVPARPTVRPLEMEESPGAVPWPEQGAEPGGLDRLKEAPAQTVRYIGLVVPCFVVRVCPLRLPTTRDQGNRGQTPYLNPPIHSLMALLLGSVFLICSLTLERMKVAWLKARSKPFGMLLLLLCVVTVAVVGGCVLFWIVKEKEKETEGEGFTQGGSVAGLSLLSMSTQALDSAPSTPELKDNYKALLLFASDDIQKQGTQGLRILADFRERVYGGPEGVSNFRADLTESDFVNPWPVWLPPLDSTMKEPVPEVSTAVAAEASMLAYLQRNFPQESLVDEQTGSTIRNLIQDFGERFVFEPGTPVQVRPDFLRQSLLNNWVNPTRLP